MKYRIALLTSRYIGLIALLGGWGIFLSWTIARYFFAIDLSSLEEIGLFWLLAFFWLNLLALLLLLIYVVINRKQLHLKMLSTAFIIILSIPSVILIIFWQANIEKKTFVKIKNDSNIEELELNLHSTLFSKNIGSVKKGSSTVFNYEAPYVFCERLYQKRDSLFLTIKYHGNIDTLDFPLLYMTECYSLKIDSTLNIEHSVVPKELYF